METAPHAGLPAVHRLLSDAEIAAYQPLLGRSAVRDCVRAAVDQARKSSHADGPPVARYAHIRSRALQLLAAREAAGLIGVINGSGVLLHTNLGRAPLASAAFEAARAIGCGYSNLEYDLQAGARGDRYDRVGAQLRELSGAQGALCVNNCAAAVLLVLDTFAREREVVVSRGQLIEIGGSFRLPDVVAKSGALLVEVGTTNRTYSSDYRNAHTAQTALFMRTHPSNYRTTGYTADVRPAELAAAAAELGVISFEDLGSGALIDLSPYGLPHEPTVRESIEGGIDLVAFSGDKLLGGPQCGIICGRAALIDRMKRNQLLRALRVDKLTLAALSATLALYCEPARLREIPLFAMLELTADSLRRRAERLCANLRELGLAAEFRSSDALSTTGGGTLPCVAIASAALRVRPTDQSADALAKSLRNARPPVIGLIEDGDLAFDLRTIPDDQDAPLSAALARAL
ncbi:MAG: L-seryl-tRNA(Sec) selenium transferase [Candidatus Eremiobacteraeota bacterium]|nr:L-seryl-tRNA(Sec) selenium transferase [Candidatus Eremiobacteraeota bacterium]